MFSKAKIVCKNADPAEYRKDDLPRGDKKRVVSASDLKIFSQYCPSKWVRGYEPPGGDSMLFGSLLDTRLLTPKQFDARFAVTPLTYKDTGMQCPECKSITDSQKCSKCKRERVPIEIEKPWSGNATVCKEWATQQGAKEIVVQKNVDDADEGIKRMREVEIIAAWLDDSDRQIWLSAFWLDEKTGLKIPVRALLDTVPRLGTEWAKSLGDCKTTTNATKGAFKNQIFKRDWHMQAAFYEDFYIAATAEDRCNFTLFGCENYKPFEPYTRSLSLAFMDEGRRKYKFYLALYAKCLASGKWPSYDDGFTLVEPDPWMEFAGQQAAMEATYQEELENNGDLIP